jgi:Recombination endonuclease VII
MIVSKDNMNTKESIKKAQQQKYNNSAKGKETRKRYANSPKGKKVIKKWNNSTEKKEYNRKYQKEYHNRPEREEYNQKYQKEYYIRTKEIRKENMRKWRKTPEGMEYGIIYRKSSKGQESYQKSTLKQHSITIDDYNKLFKKQNGVCAICLKPPTRRRFDVDHDHSCCPGSKSCGKCVRGLLCHSCNHGLGQLNDSVSILQKAIKYLKNYRNKA